MTALYCSLEALYFLYFLVSLSYCQFDRGEALEKELQNINKMNSLRSTLKGVQIALFTVQ